MNSTIAPSPLQTLLANASARFGLPADAIAAALDSEMFFTSAYGPLNKTLINTTVNGHEVQLQIGRGAGCLTCTRNEEKRRRISAGSIAKLVTCPQAAAAAVKFVIDRSPERYVSELAQASVESVSETEAETLTPPTPAAEEAAGLVSEYPHLAKRIGLALELIETGQLAGQMQKYGTEWQNLTRAGNWICDCPDSLHRQPVAAFGRACKHCLAGEILARVKRTRQRIAMQKLASKNARRSEESARRYALALSPGGGSPLNTPRYQFGRGR
jgi:hypothetical protein